MTQQGRVENEDQTLGTTAHLFNGKGVHNTSKRELAEAMGLRKRSLCCCIESKEELLRSLVEGGSSSMADETGEVCATDPPPAR